MNVLIACEESQRVCAEFRARGHNAYSCDVQEPSGGHPEWHILGDVLPILRGGCFRTMNGETHDIGGRWDLIIAHPPCTYLSNVATRHHSLRCTPLDKINARTLKRIDAEAFFMRIATADCERIAIENPVGVMNTVYRAPDQVIHPYMFSGGAYDTENFVTKGTCLWLKGLPALVLKCTERPDNRALFGEHPSGKSRDWEAVVTGGDRAKLRSKTFPGIARAMAEQWGGQEGVPAQVRIDV